MTTGQGKMNERMNEIATIDNGIFGFLSEGKHRIILTPSISRNTFSSTQNRKAGVFKSLRFEFPFRDGLV